VLEQSTLSVINPLRVLGVKLRTGQCSETAANPARKELHHVLYLARINGGQRQQLSFRFRLELEIDDLSLAGDAHSGPFDFAFRRMVWLQDGIGVIEMDESDFGSFVLL